MRVIVVLHDRSGRFLRTCENWHAYDQWVENSLFDKDEVRPVSSHVYEER